MVGNRLYGSDIMIKNKCALPECGNLRKTKDNFPFCSELCKMTDLYNWLSGEYKIDNEPPISFVDDERDLSEKFWKN